MADRAKQHIFFVDDEPKIQEVVSEALKELGAEVSCFSRASDCLERLRGEPCDLLITDVKMPEMDGMELLSELRCIAPWVPVLIITGYADISMAFSAGKKGAVDFMEKPLNREGFLRKVKSLLQRRAMQDSRVGRPLTKAETRVLKLLVRGKSNKEIAQLLHRSIRTVEVHRSQIMRKFGVSSLAELMGRVIAMGLVEVPSKS